MHRRALRPLALIAIAVSLLAALTSSAAAEISRPEILFHGVARTATPPEESDAVCAKNDYPPNDEGITAQRFPAIPELTSFGAADFKLSRRCDVTSVSVSGIGEGANRIVVWIYENTSRDLPSPPGTSKCSAAKAAPGPDFVVPVSDCMLKKGHYWLAVQVDTGLTWFWATTGHRIGFDDAWRNPSDGWETSCVEWGTVDTCPQFRWDYLFSIT